MPAGQNHAEDIRLAAYDEPLAPGAQLTAKKKSLHASERDTGRVQQARAEYRAGIAGLELSRLPFIDESGVKLALTRLYGRAPRGERAVGSTPIHYGQNLTLIGALGSGGLEALLWSEGAPDGEVFRADTEQILCPTLEPGDIVVMDNLGAPKVSGSREAIEACGAKLISLPPYAPDLSPMERCWAKIKTALRGIGARTRRKLERAIKRAIATITESDALAWFAQCGYKLN
jgi:transposase